MSIFFEQRPKSSTPVVPVSCALLLHAAVLACLLRVSSTSLSPMRLPGTSLGTHLSLTYLPGRMAQRSALVKANQPSLKHLAVASTALPMPPVAPQVSSDARAPSTNPSDPAEGNDALGTGNVNIALAIHFPTPKPDLTQLPPGTVGDVVVDIVIDAAGNVSSVTMHHGLGSGIDEVVVATVQQWSFHPATRDGQPVASEQELHFHYQRT